MRKGRCPPGQRPLLPLFEMHAVFFVAAFTRFFILLCGIAESEVNEFMEILGLATNCDMMDLVDENRRSEWRPQPFSAAVPVYRSPPPFQAAFRGR